jgi:hypothetical protein
MRAPALLVAAGMFHLADPGRNMFQVTNVPATERSLVARVTKCDFRQRTNGATQHSAVDPRAGGNIK